MKSAFSLFVLLSILSFAIMAVAQVAGESTPEQGSAPDLSNAPFHNPALPVEQRVNDLVSRMTLEEKVSQMVHVAAAIPRLGIPEYN